MSFEFRVLGFELRKFRYLRWRLRPAEVVSLVLILILCGAALGVAMSQTRNPELETRNRTERANAIYTAWNDMAASMVEEDKLLAELHKNLNDNPPRLVFDPRRREIYALVITEHRRQLADFETMRKADR